MTHQNEAIAEIDEMLKQLKIIKRKIYCSHYYVQNKTRILKQIRDFKKDKTHFINNKTNFKIEKTQHTIIFN